MLSVLVFLFALLAFFISSRGLIDALTENIKVEKFVKPYSVQALKVGRAYKVFAWAAMTLFLFLTTVRSFLVVFDTL